MTPEFRQQMVRMAGLKFAPESLQTHWEGLSDVRPDLLEMAVSTAIKECSAATSATGPRSVALRVDPRVVGDEARSVALESDVEVSIRAASLGIA